MGRDGLVISLREAGFFDSGSATPKPAALPTLRQIAARLGTTPYDLRIEGHTDNVPIHNAEFASNWDLSTARATAVAMMLLNESGVDPKRISIAGYAQYHPTARTTLQKAGKLTGAWILLSYLRSIRPVLAPNNQCLGLMARKCAHF
jgi:chemotaxis protein MotB